MEIGDNGSGKESRINVCTCHGDLIESIDGLLLRLITYEKTAAKLIGYLKLIIGYVLLTKISNLEPDAIDRLLKIFSQP